MPKPIKCCLYLRVSSQEQVQDGYGLEYQEQNLRELVQHKAKFQGWTVDEAHVFREKGFSGANTNRPAFQQMMKAVKNGEIDMIVVWKLDRLARDMFDLLSMLKTLDKYGVSFYSLKENFDFSGSIGKLILHVICALSEFERSMIRDRTSEGKISSAKMGNFMAAHVPYGYRKVKNDSGKGSHLAMMQEEAAWVQRIYDWFTLDKKNYNEIAQELNKIRLPKSHDANRRLKNTKWYADTIKKMLTASIYKGVIELTLTDSNGDTKAIFQDAPAIVDAWQWELAKERAKEVSKERKNSGGNNKTKGKYLLSRKIVEESSGRTFVAYTRSKDNRISYRRQAFVDTNELRHKNKEIAGLPIEKAVWREIERLIKTPKLFYKIYAEQVQEGKTLDDIQKERQAIEIQEKQLQKKQNRIFHDYYDGNITLEQRDTFVEDIESSLQNIAAQKNELSIAEKSLLHLQQANHTILHFSEKMKKNIKNLSKEDKKTLINMLIDKVIIDTKQKNMKAHIRFRFVRYSEKGTRANNEPFKLDYERQQVSLRPLFSSSGEKNDQDYFFLTIFNIPINFLVSKFSNGGNIS